MTHLIIVGGISRDPSFRRNSGVVCIAQKVREGAIPLSLISTTCVVHGKIIYAITTLVVFVLGELLTGAGVINRHASGRVPRHLLILFSP